METPEGWAGELAKQIMQRIRSNMKGKQQPPLETASYNTIYSSVFEILFREQTRPERKP